MRHSAKQSNGCLSLALSFSFFFSQSLKPTLEKPQLKPEGVVGDQGSSEGQGNTERWGDGEGDRQRKRKKKSREKKKEKSRNHRD